MGGLGLVKLIFYLQSMLTKLILLTHSCLKINKKVQFNHNNSCLKA